MGRWYAAGDRTRQRDQQGRPAGATSRGDRTRDPGSGDLLAPGAGHAHGLVGRTELALVVHRQPGLTPRLLAHPALPERARGPIGTAERGALYRTIAHGQ